MNEVRARVILQEKGIYTLKYEGEEHKAEVSGKFRFDAESLSDYPAVGDYVVASWPEDGSNSIISGVFPRKSIFIRKAAGNGNREQIVASNVDTLFLCMSLNQDFNLRRLERYLVISADSGATPVVVLTKSDLCDDVEAKVEAVRSVANDTEIVTVSSLEDDFEQVFKYVTPGDTIAFMGSSGVGKSTLINKLMGEEVMDTSGIRQGDDKGRHTTTHRELLELKNGAFVIDTPGMRTLGLWNNEEGTEAVFADIEELTGRCRFGNCTHGNEPGCAVRAALEDGSLNMARWNSYLKLSSENSYTANGSDYLQAKKAKFKAIAKTNKKNKNKRDLREDY